MRITFILFMLIAPANMWAQFVIVVPQNSSIDSLSHEQLYKAFKGQHLDEKIPQPLQIVEFEPESDDFYEQLYGMNAFAVGKLWLRKIFAGDRVFPPKNFSDLDKYVDFIKKNRRAVGFLSKGKFLKIKQGSLKAIVIDMMSYNQPGYRLK